MSDYTIILGNKAYSSWSLRGWLALRQTGVPFEEIVIPLDQPESRESILAYSPSGRVPCLLAPSGAIWDSLSIVEYLAESHPDAGLWPVDPWARAMARTAAAEMHAGFSDLRTEMWMDLKSQRPGEGRTPAVEADIARISQIWTRCRGEFGQDGPFLFGAYSAADAMYAPVCARFKTYEVALDPVCAAYRDAVLEQRDMREWIEAALAEPWVLGPH
ncbi:MAG: glutathione S-transferase family protein [Pseudomonadota bacterium]